MLKEKTEIMAWRSRYLRQVKQFRQSGKKIYFLDETWVNAGHTVQKVWQDTNIQTPRQAFVNGLSTGLKNPSGKGKRLIVLHIGSEDGFVENALLLFESKKTGDYHEEMNSEVFQNWFKEVLPNLEEESVIIMDNASYHSRKSEKVVNSSSKKADIQAWLTRKNVSYELEMTKWELLMVVKHIPVDNNYVVDKMAKDSGRKVVRLPPYHCELNPIELIWAQVKGHVARNNTTFNIKHVRNLFQDAIQNVSANDWKNAIQHVMRTEEEMWRLDMMLEDQAESLVIQLGNDSSSSDSSDSDAE